tara:strand:+ start:906 stop:1328 length:423 start_codon:yes stop_codon:yes gene_type:complete
LQVINCLQSTLQENFEIIIVSNGSVDQLFFKEWKLLEQIFNLTFTNLSEGGVIGTCDGSASLGVVNESDFTKVISWGESSNFLTFVTHFVFVVDLNDTFTSFNEEHGFIFADVVILFYDSGFRFFKLDLHFADDFVKEVD